MRTKSTESHRFPLLVLLLSVFTFTAAVGRAQLDPDLCDWQKGFDFRDLKNDVLTATLFDAGNGPELYIGGRFRFVGPDSASYIAVWRDDEWRSVAPGAGFANSVHSLVVWGRRFRTGSLRSRGLRQNRWRRSRAHRAMGRNDVDDAVQFGQRRGGRLDSHHRSPRRRSRRVSICRRELHQRRRHAVTQRRAMGWCRLEPPRRAFRHRYRLRSIDRARSGRIR